MRHSYLEVPKARYIGTFVGFEEPFDTAKLRRLYGDEATYAELASKAIDQLEVDRLLLPEHAEQLRAEAAAFAF